MLKTPASLPLAPGLSKTPRTPIDQVTKTAVDKPLQRNQANAQQTKPAASPPARPLRIRIKEEVECRKAEDALLPSSPLPMSPGGAQKKSRVMRLNIWAMTFG